VSIFWLSSTSSSPLTSFRVSLDQAADRQSLTCPERALVSTTLEFPALPKHSMPTATPAAPTAPVNNYFASMRCQGMINFADRAIEASRSGEAAIRGERHAPNNVVVPSETRPFRQTLLRHIPYLDPAHACHAPLSQVGGAREASDTNTYIHSRSPYGGLNEPWPCKERGRRCKVIN
jgi:hypothetical protein